MISAKKTVFEEERIQELENYQILDTLPENEYDEITKIASEICQMPIALISFIDSTRQWFKSHHGVIVSETPREYAFCAHAILNKDEPCIINDSRNDIRFHDNPLVTGNPSVIFYAGIPLKTLKGNPIGTLCVIDTKPNQLTDTQISSLKALSHQVVALLELRKKNNELTKISAQLRDRVEELEQFSALVVHDVKSPINNIICLTNILRTEHATQLDEEGREYLSLIEFSNNRLKNYIDGLISYYKGEQLVEHSKVEINLLAFLTDSIQGIDPQKKHEFKFLDINKTIAVNKIALEQILQNLLHNAIKYNKHEKATIEINFEESKTHYIFHIKDDGIGMEEKDIKKIFNLFTTLGKKDRNGETGTGIGLSTTKKIIESLQGEISVTSTPNVGSTFTFTIKK